MRKMFFNILGVVLVSVVLLLSVKSPCEAFVGGGGLALKLGVFLPNGDSEGNGLEDWDNGFDVGFYGSMQVHEHLAIDLGGGLSHAAHTTRVAGDEASESLLVFRLPTLVAKLTHEPLPGLTISAGGGVGLYFPILSGDPYEEYDNGRVSGIGIGPVLKGAVEYSLGGVSLLAEVEWSRAEANFPDLDRKINVGGLMLSGGILF